MTPAFTPRRRHDTNTGRSHDTCWCGNWKPQLARTCWRHSERDPVFRELDELIAAGLGDEPREQRGRTA